MTGSIGKRSITLPAWCVLLVSAVHGQLWVEHAIPAPEDVTADGRFGTALALDGGLLLIGAPGTDAGAPGSGAAYLRDRDNGGQGAWDAVARLVPPQFAADAAFGTSVALHGDLAFISAPGDAWLGLATGSLYVFQRDLGGPDNWGFKQRIVCDTVSAGLGFARTFVVRDSLLLANCPGYDEDPSDALPGLGAIAVFRQHANGLFDPVRFVRGDAFVDVVPPGGRPCVSNWFDVFEGDLVHTSATKVYTVEAAALSVPDAPFPAATIVHLTDSFGFPQNQLYFDNGDTEEGTLLLVMRHSSTAELPRALCFQHGDQGELVQGGQMYPDPAVEPDRWRWGRAVDLAGQRALIGAYGHELFVPNGHAEVFDRDPDVADGWARVAYLTASDEHTGDQFARSVALGDDIAVIGAPGSGDLNVGKVYIYHDPFASIAPVGHRGTSVIIYPHPVPAGSACVFLSVEPANASGVATTFSADGRCLRQLRASGSCALSLEQLPPGNYFLSWLPDDPSLTMAVLHFIVVP